MTQTPGSLYGKGLSELDMNSSGGCYEVITCTSNHFQCASIMIRNNFPMYRATKSMYAEPWVPGHCKRWRGTGISLLVYLTLVTSLYYVFQVLILFGYQTLVRDKDCMHEIPECASYNSVRTLSHPCGGIMIHVPHNTHPFSMLSSVLLAINGQNSSPFTLIWPALQYVLWLLGRNRILSSPFPYLGSLYWSLVEVFHE